MVFDSVCRKVILDSSMVEHSAVNRRVVGSSPTRGVKGGSTDTQGAGVFTLRAVSAHTDTQVT